MVLKRLLAGVGFGGASVETQLDGSPTWPGGSVRGTVHIQGGEVDQRVEQLTVGYQARVEVEFDDSEGHQNMDFHRVQLGGELHLQPGQQIQVPFEIPTPWETPITTYQGQYLHKMKLGVNTRLHVAGAIDPGDLDPVRVDPLPAQRAILDALDSLGFRFQQADMEKGRLRGTRQQLPFYQEIEYRAPSRYQGLNNLELSFVTDERGIDVVLELDKKPGLLFSEGRDTFHQFSIAHGGEAQDWTGYLHHWIDSIAGQRGWL
ncbi:sporulation protein [Nocardiopsis sp. YSL2]|uniref:sporulation protein n=1 Tax=Nocardiopsis sp. YSL2 TaxID=2939492 RepID=UPI0026F40EFB|nr:sporulation protein [Nocardiopsis sp. YSL2]